MIKSLGGLELYFFDDKNARQREARIRMWRRVLLFFVVVCLAMISIIHYRSTDSDKTNVPVDPVVVPVPGDRV